MRRYPSSWTTILTQLGLRRTPRNSARKAARHATPRFESLEARRVMANVADVHLFYNDSGFDGFDAAITSADVAAIATDKQPLTELGQASFENYSSYHRGINGVMVDLENANGPRLSDFIFNKSVGLDSDGQPSNWQPAASPTGFKVLAGQGVNGSDRVVFTWDDTSAVKNGWLQITVNTGTPTGLLQRETFYFGSAVGETGDSLGSTRVNSNDYILARRNLHSLLDPAAIDDAFDINRDQRVDGSDLTLIRRNYTNFQTDVPLVTAPLNAPTHLHAETFSSSEAYFRWHDQAFAETGYRLTAYDQSGDVLFTQDAPAESSAMLVEGLAAGLTYTFDVTPLGGDQSNRLLQSSNTISVTMPERLTGLTSSSGWYLVTLNDTTPTRGAAGSTYQSGALSIDASQADVIDAGSGKAYVHAESGEAAVFKAVTGTTTIEHYDAAIGVKTFDIDTSGAYDVGQVSDLKSQHAGWGHPVPRAVPYVNNDDQWLIVIENLRERSGVSSDEDFDDFVWAVDVEEANIIDLDITQVFVPDDQEVSPGGVVKTNGDTTVLTLREIGQNASGSTTLDFDESRVLIWKDASKTERVIPSNASDPATQFDPTQEHKLYAEGVSPGYPSVSVSVTATFEPAGYSEGAVSDEVVLRVVNFDLDIDSDNDNGITSPERDDWEEELEDHEYGLGKLIEVNSDGTTHTKKFTPIVLDFGGSVALTEEITFSFQSSGDAGDIELWTQDRHSDPTGAIQIVSGTTYKLEDLNYSSGSGELIVYIQATDPTDQTSLDDVEEGRDVGRITASFQGATDTVQYVVTNNPSIFWKLQTNAPLRSALAARGSYPAVSDDLKNVALKPMSEDDFETIGLSNISSKFGDNAEGVPSNFNAAGWQDYTAEEDFQYIIGFAGTDEAIDWVDNLEQATGLNEFGDQYNEAIAIGDALAGITAAQKTQIRLAGHSLGGGLASAAAVVGNIEADTFNAAGLLRVTIENGTTVAGSLGRYDAAASLIDAWYNDLDPLSWIQDNSIAQDAIGDRNELDGINRDVNTNLYDFLDDWTLYDADEFAETGYIVPAHAINNILYGFLVEEDGNDDPSADFLEYDPDELDYDADPI